MSNSGAMKICPYCGKSFHYLGFSSHRAACRRKTKADNKIIKIDIDMSRLSDEWCCMNCVHQEECLSDDPNLNLLGYCIQYEDAETSN